MNTPNALSSTYSTKPIEHNASKAQIAEKFVGAMMSQFAQVMFQGVNDESFEQEMFTSMLAQTLGEQLAKGNMMKSLKDLVERRLNGQGFEPVHQVAGRIQAYQTNAGENHVNLAA